MPPLAPNSRTPCWRGRTHEPTPTRFQECTRSLCRGTAHRHPLRPLVAVGIHLRVRSQLGLDRAAGVGIDGPLPLSLCSGVRLLSLPSACFRLLSFADHMGKTKAGKGDPSLGTMFALANLHPATLPSPRHSRLVQPYHICVHTMLGRCSARWGGSGSGGGGGDAHNGGGPSQGRSVFAVAGVTAAWPAIRKEVLCRRNRSTAATRSFLAQHNTSFAIALLPCPKHPILAFSHSSPAQPSPAQPSPAPIKPMLTPAAEEDECFPYSSPQALPRTERLSKFVNYLIHAILQRLPDNVKSTPALYHNKGFQQSSELIHSVLRSTQNFIPLSVIILSLIFISDLSVSPFKISAGSEPHLFLVSLMVAHKFSDDYAVVSTTWSRISGLPQGQISLLERQFCQAMNYNFTVEPEVFGRWQDYFDAHAAYWL
ncbi:uncharacterized protein BJ171DRAFT_476899 [Polychytrium aggregatum]|uniref:uncharacterized protein n=1 Tax=Polychytrium aggregatum TaxID=110093 RepID=UPI0022FEA254|nr:uncharacterized protein BJ171DRAFT_476899 [Polychytrium aggregatum]KAI9202238.1 hypothetical protein BJ171DRAFT_476899 [Polychytrium aggregatum]